MSRTFVSFPVSNIKEFKKRLLTWANRFEVCCFLDNHTYPSSHKSYECMLGAGVASQLTASAGNAFVQLKAFYESKGDWIFGHLSYDLKNEIELLDSSHYDRIGFPDLFFFVPQTVVLLKNNEVSIGNSDPGFSQELFEEISSTSIAKPVKQCSPVINKGFSKEAYISTIQQLQQHIKRGDCYEINFCQEFFSDNALLNPLQVYFSLSDISPNPFAAYYKINDKYLCCASPERYLKKEGKKLTSQPIKGTGPRNHESADNDILNKDELFLSEKDRTENVMIVDLVRNDLSKVCDEGTVMVDELYGIYSYPQVHQMISTVSGVMKKGVDWTDAIEACFPIGSMTGAPKKRVMELIEQYEKTKRGLFSGSVGYVSPQADFDFNVVIRSIFYNKEEQCMSYQVGSAITFSSDPEKEYEECLLKAAAITAILS